MKPYKVGYTTGVFDLFHIGHLNIISKAKEYCESLIVGVCTDELAFRLKNKRPVIAFEERIEIVGAIRHVDSVVPQCEIDEISDWKRLGFDAIFKGNDWEGTEKWAMLKREFDKVGVAVVFLPYTKGTSSTKIQMTLDEFQAKSNLSK